MVIGLVSFTRFDKLVLQAFVVFDQGILAF